ncbi:MAG: efflux RND transporter periplasmic adaptor subunit [Gammaproteobacteria bacterium]|nr:efflux RND transporter periplasmic adaptor subunit [Gammaproteobacteria bacterium]
MVGTAAVVPATFVDAIEAIGTTYANESVQLTAKAADTVSRVDFEDGDLIEAGAVLVQQTNQEQTALLAEAQANLRDARTQLQRLEDLDQRGLATKSDLDSARNRFDAAKARLDAIVARLDDRLIRAPFGGLLGFRQVSPGSFVAPGTVIATLDDIATIKLDFTVPETYLGRIVPGEKVLAQSAAWPQREFEGTVRTLDSRVDPVTRSVVVRATFDNADRALRPGMLLTVKLVTAEIQALAVPEIAVQQNRNEYFVFVAADGRAQQRRILVGRRRARVAEVTEGLAAGEQVITEGLVKVRDGMAIEAHPEGNSNPAIGS